MLIAIRYYVIYHMYDVTSLFIYMIACHLYFKILMMIKTRNMFTLSDLLSISIIIIIPTFLIYHLILLMSIAFVS